MQPHRSSLFLTLLFNKGQETSLQTVTLDAVSFHVMTVFIFEGPLSLFLHFYSLADLLIKMNSEA